MQGSAYMGADAQGLAVGSKDDPVLDLTYLPSFPCPRWKVYHPIRRKRYSHKENK